MKPHLRAIDRRLRVQPDHPAWAAASERWRALADAAATDLAAYARGQPMADTRRRVAEEVAKLAKEAKPLDVWRIVAAVVMLWQHEPQRFRSDRAFHVQVAKVVRRLGDVNVGSAWCPKGRRVRRIYRDPPLRVMEAMGRDLATALGIVGVRIARLDDAEAERQRKARADLNAALDTLGQPGGPHTRQAGQPA